MPGRPAGGVDHLGNRWRDVTTVHVRSQFFALIDEYADRRIGSGLTRPPGLGGFASPADRPSDPRLRPSPPGPTLARRPRPAMGNQTSAEPPERFTLFYAFNAFHQSKGMDDRKDPPGEAENQETQEFVGKSAD